MSRSRRMIFPLLPLLSLVQFSCAGFGTHYSAPGRAPFLNLYEPTAANTWAAYHPLRTSYASPPPSLYPSTYPSQNQQQSPLAPLSTPGAFQLYPLPIQSIFKSEQQPLRPNSAGQDSLFYSASDQAYYKVTKVNPGGTKGNAGYGPPTPHYTSTPAPYTHPPSTYPPTPPPTTHTPPTTTPYTHRPEHYTQRPSYKIEFSVIESGPDEGCPGGGAEGMNPALTPLYGVYHAPAGCPPESSGGSPHIGAPVPLNPDTSVYSSSSSSASSFSSSFSSSESQFSGGVSGVDGVPSTTYGAPSQYGPPPHKHKYGDPVRPIGDGSSGRGAPGDNNVQSRGKQISWKAIGDYSQSTRG